MSILSLIIKREFIAKVRNKSFIVMTFLSPLLIVGLSFFVGYLATMNKDEVTKIAIHDELSILKADFKNTKETVYVDLSGMPLQLAKDTASKNYEGLIFIPKVANIQELSEKVQYISDDSPSMKFIITTEKVINNKLTQANLAVLGFDNDKIEKAEVSSNIHLTKFSGEDTIKGINEMKIAIGGAFGYLIMMFIVIYGNFVMRSVIEEKTSRIIEIIISSVKPYQLMMGKIIGNSLAGILQFAIWAIVGGILMFSISAFFGIQTGAESSVDPEMVGKVQEGLGITIQSYVKEILNLPLGTLISSFIIYFIGGYFLYSSFYAAIGAAVDSETDSQQFLLPIIMPLILGVYIGFFTVVNDPHGTVAIIFSMVPLTSPIVMLMRIPFGVPWWQLAISITLLFATFLGVVWFAAKIYRVGILMYGKKPTWKELYKWLQY
ncbi:ABC transporter permease [Flavobacterium sp.]|uniref:ABC transporter permease n=1 Tax=Flavobacterium sp. TaxID=239 RepID=UPI00286E7339|nr:ABC transporter permease [Flavobacterium sp.]